MNKKQNKKMHKLKSNVTTLGIIFFVKLFYFCTIKQFTKRPQDQNNVRFRYLPEFKLLTLYFPGLMVLSSYFKLLNLFINYFLSYAFSLWYVTFVVFKGGT